MIVAFAKLILNTKLRRTNRFVRRLAMYFPNLQKVPITILGNTLFLDLRVNTTHELLLNPKTTEPDLEIIKKIIKLNYIVYDIGTHIGLFTIHLSKLVGNNGKVYSFEPNPSVLSALKKTISKLNNVELFELALSNKKGKEDLAVPEDHSMASLKDWTKGKNGKVSHSVCVTDTLDGLIESKLLIKPDFIKCDIEGGEYDCFCGGKNLLNQVDSPIVLFEANINSTAGYEIPIHKAMTFLSSLEKSQYTFFLINENCSLKEITSLDVSHANILAVPKSKLETLSEF